MDSSISNVDLADLLEKASCRTNDTAYANQLCVAATRLQAIDNPPSKPGIALMDKWLNSLSLHGSGPPGTDLDWVTHSEKFGMMLFHECKHHNVCIPPAQRAILTRLAKTRGNSVMVIQGQGAYGQDGYDLHAFWYIPDEHVRLERNITGYRYGVRDVEKGHQVLHACRQLWYDTAELGHHAPADEALKELGMFATTNMSPIHTELREW